jgi:hypothetical protein
VAATNTEQTVSITLTLGDCEALAHIIDQWIGEGFSSIEENIARAERLRAKFAQAK